MQYWRKAAMISWRCGCCAFPCCRHAVFQLSRGRLPALYIPALPSRPHSNRNWGYATVLTAADGLQVYIEMNQPIMAASLSLELGNALKVR